jgi:anti-sigma B factor antagonist
MNCVLKQKNDVLCVYLIDKLEDSIYSKMQAEISKLIKKKNIKNILVEMENLILLTSCGLKFLIFLSKLIKEKNGKLKLACLSIQAKNAILVASMDKLFEVFDNEKEALDSFA